VFCVLGREIGEIASCSSLLVPPIKTHTSLTNYVSLPPHTQKTIPTHTATIIHTTTIIINNDYKTHTQLPFPFFKHVECSQKMAMAWELMRMMTVSAVRTSTESAYIIHDVDVSLTLQSDEVEESSP